ncbi:hypothetical protein FKM82_017607 [Ascaphus truei]
MDIVTIDCLVSKYASSSHFSVIPETTSSLSKGIDDLCMLSVLIYLQYSCITLERNPLNYVEMCIVNIGGNGRLILEPICISPT